MGTAREILDEHLRDQYSSTEANYIIARLDALLTSQPDTIEEDDAGLALLDDALRGFEECAQDLRILLAYWRAATVGAGSASRAAALRSSRQAQSRAP